MKARPNPFECTNCGHKPTATEVVLHHGDCPKCEDRVIAYTVDAAECIEMMDAEAKAQTVNRTTAGREVPVCPNCAMPEHRILALFTPQFTKNGAEIGRTCFHCHKAMKITMHVTYSTESMTPT